MTETLAPSDIALDAIQRYPDADNPSSFLAVNEGNSYLHRPDTPGVIAPLTATAPDFIGQQAR